MTGLVRDPFNLIITGVGGQGNVLMSQILGRALIDQGFHVAVGETFGLSQRGGSVQSHIRVSARQTYGPLIPFGEADAVAGLEPLETLRVLPPYGRPETLVLVNGRPLYPQNVIAGEARYPEAETLAQIIEKLAGRVIWVPATETAARLGAAIMANIVLLGALAGSGLLPIEAIAVEQALADVFPPQRLAKNIDAFHAGTALAAKE
jgi:indolepyruvate ferredoxin oxidoreductase beta subunit